MAPSQNKKKRKNDATSAAGRPSRGRAGRMSMQIRVILLAIGASIYWKGEVLTWLTDTVLFPWGSAVEIPESERESFGSVNKSETLLQVKHGKTIKIVQRIPQDKEGNDLEKTLVKGPETIIVHPTDPDHVFFFNENAQLIKVDLTDLKPLQDKKGRPSKSIMTAPMTVVRTVGRGRPLSARFSNDGILYVCDVHLGLTRIRDVDNPHSKLEIVASHAPDATPIAYADDLVIGPKTGKIYFSDASDIPVDYVEKFDENVYFWDVMHAFRLDFMRGIPTGRILEYDPATGKVQVLATGLKFANGVGVGDADETFLVVAETSRAKVHKLHLRGDKRGHLEPLIESTDMVGYPDGVDCLAAAAGATYCYAALPSSILFLHTLLNVLPHPVDAVLRSLFMLMPREISPGPKAYGGVLEMHVSSDGGVESFRVLQDPTGKDITSLTSVRYNPHDNRLYLGSNHNDYIGVYSLDD